MATAMKLSVPKPVNLPSMKKVRPRPDALTRNQRRSALFPNKRRNASAPGGRPALTRDRFHHRRSTPGTMLTRSWFRTASRAAGPARKPATTREGPRNRRTPPTRRGERSIAPAPRGRRARTRPEPRASTATTTGFDPSTSSTESNTPTTQPTTSPRARRATSSSVTKQRPGSGASEGWTRAITQP